MNSLIIASCLLAVVAASHYEPHYPIHIPVIGPHGVPLEPVEVIHARQEHLAAHAAAKSHHGYATPVYQQHGGYESTVAHGSYAVAAPVYGGHYGYAHHVPVIGHNGVPLDTPEVAHAKAEHFAAHAKALAAVSHGHGYQGYGEHYRRRRSIHEIATSYSNLYAPVGHQVPVHVSHHVPVIGHGGVPLDTPEVAAAKAAHFAAHHAAASAHYAPEHYAISAHYAPEHHAISAHYAPEHVTAHVGHVEHYAPEYHHHVQHYPVIGHDGQPLETPEVVALKHAHFAAHAEANARNLAHAGHHDAYHHHY